MFLTSDKKKDDYCLDGSDDKEPVAAIQDRECMTRAGLKVKDTSSEYLSDEHYDKD